MNGFLVFSFRESCFLLDAQASGHAGMSTFHAHSPQEAIYRLQQLLLRTGTTTRLAWRRRYGTASSAWASWSDTAGETTSWKWRSTLMAAFGLRLHRPGTGL